MVSTHPFCHNFVRANHAQAAAVHDTMHAELPHIATKYFLLMHGRLARTVQLATFSVNYPPSGQAVLSALSNVLQKLLIRFQTMMQNRYLVAALALVLISLLLHVKQSHAVCSLLTTANEYTVSCPVALPLHTAVDNYIHTPYYYVRTATIITCSHKT